MKTNSIPLSHNGQRVAQARMAGRRALPAVPRASRHMRWIAGIVAKHLNHTSWRGAFAGAMTLLHPDQRTQLRLQTIMRLAEPRAASTPPPMGANAPQIVQVLQRQFVQPRIFIQQHDAQRLQPLFFAARELPNSDKPKLTASAPPTSLHALRSLERSVVERLTLRTTVSEQIADTGRLPLLIAGRRAGRFQQVISEDEAANLPQRVIRRLRRLEERPFHHPRQAAVRMIAAPEPEEATAARRLRLAPDTQARASIEARTAGHAAQEPAAVNIGQITDAVLQQLDRRLLAARERMGRI